VIQETSLDSWRQITDLGDRQRKVYNIIKIYPGLCNRQYSEILQRPINTVTPRVKELRVMGLVKEGEKKYDKVTNRWVMTWEVIP
jgi:hypothetical protein